MQMVHTMVRLRKCCNRNDRGECCTNSPNDYIDLDLQTILQMWRLLLRMENKVDHSKENDHEATTEFDELVKRYVIADNTINLPTCEAIQDFFGVHIRDEAFGGDTVRNTPLNRSNLGDLQSCMMRQGVSALNFGMTVAVNAEMVDYLTSKRNEGDLNIQELKEKVPWWRATLIDGHHRRDALIALLDNPEFKSHDLKIRVWWVRDNDDHSALRG